MPVFVPAVSLSFSLWLLFMLFSFSINSPSVWSCKQQGQQAEEGSGNNSNTHFKTNSFSLQSCSYNAAHRNAIRQINKESVQPALVSKALPTAASCSWGWRGCWGRWSYLTHPPGLIGVGSWTASIWWRRTEKALGLCYVEVLIDFYR